MLILLMLHSSQTNQGVPCCWVLKFINYECQVCIVITIFIDTQPPLPASGLWYDAIQTQGTSDHLAARSCVSAAVCGRCRVAAAGAGDKYQMLPNYTPLSRPQHRYLIQDTFIDVNLENILSNFSRVVQDIGQLHDCAELLLTH